MREVGQEKGDGTRSRFLPPAAFGVSPICQGSDILDREKLARERLLARNARTIAWRYWARIFKLYHSEVAGF